MKYCSEKNLRRKEEPFMFSCVINCSDSKVGIDTRGISYIKFSVQ